MEKILKTFDDIVGIDSDVIESIPNKQVNALITLSDRLSYAMRCVGVSQSALARRINVKPQVIQYLCTTSSVHSTRFAHAICGALEIDLEWLLTGKGEMQAEAAIQAKTHIQKLPLLEWDQIGAWVTDTKHRDTSNVAKWAVSDIAMSSDSYAVRLMDDSMSPRFEEGTILLIDPLEKPKHKDFVIVKPHHDSHALFRQYLVNANDKHLSPLHPVYRKIILEDKFNFLGVMKQSRFNY